MTLVERAIYLRVGNRASEQTTGTGTFAGLPATLHVIYGGRHTQHRRLGDLA